jgi:hypothetical protein
VWCCCRSSRRIARSSVIVMIQNGVTFYYSKIKHKICFTPLNNSLSVVGSLACGDRRKSSEIVYTLHTHESTTNSQESVSSPKQNLFLFFEQKRSKALSLSL